MEPTPPSLSLNDEADYGLCFACGPRNPSGLRLRFERRGDSVTTTFRGGEAHQGFPGYVHGGIISAVLDEVMSRVSLLDNRWTMTARMDVRYRRPVLVDQSVTAVAEKGRVMRRFVEVSGRVHLPDGAIAAEATGTFAFLDREDLTRITAGYPGLAEEWMRSS
jgi:uncharacterized protein (TIGR00369 family)